MSDPPPPTVYVSYAAADTAWVTGELAERLKRAGVRQLGRKDINPGPPEMDEMQRLLGLSRYVLVVVTPAYVSDHHRRFETVLILQHGFDSLQWMTIPVIREPTEDLPLYLSGPGGVDVSGGDEAEWERLVEAVTKEPRPMDDLASPASFNALRARQSQPKISAGLIALQDLMQVREVREAVGGFAERFEDASAQIEILADYKEMHDELHKLASGTFRLLIEAQRTFDEPRTRGNLIGYSSDLRTIRAKVESVAVRPTFSPAQTAWVAHLTEAQRLLDETSETGKPEPLGDAIWNLRRVLGQEPSKLNDRMIEAARHLRLSKLVHAMDELGEALTQRDLDRGLVDEFIASIGHLADFYHRLQRLIVDHDEWQVVEGHLRLVETGMQDEEDIAELQRSWPFLRTQAEPLYRDRQEQWAELLRKHAGKCAEALEALKLGDTPLLQARKAGEAQSFREDNVREALTAFWNFAGYAHGQFLSVDTAVRSVCGELRLVGASLSGVVEFLRRFSND
jgi:hypothetical protein